MKPSKNSGYEACMSFLGWQYTLCILAHQCQGGQHILRTKESFAFRILPMRLFFWLILTCTPVIISLSVRTTGASEFCESF